MNLKAKILPILVLLPILSQAQELQHFLEFEHTGRSMKLMIIQTTYNEAPAPEGMEIGAFTPQELLAGAGIIQCDGVAEFVVYGTANENDINGFRENEQLNFRVWDTVHEEEIIVENVEIHIGVDVWRAGTFAILSLETEREPDLRHFTDFVETHAFMSLIVHMIIYNGDPAVEGTEVGIFTPDNLLAGARVWTRDEDLEIQVWADDPETNEIDGFRDRELMNFKLWDPVAEEEISIRFPHLLRGSFRFRLNNQAIVRLNYPEPEREQPRHFNEFERTDQSMSILVMETLYNDQLARAGMEIGVFTPNNLLAGAEFIRDGGTGLVAFGDNDPDGINGFREDEIMHFKLWDPVIRREIDPDNVRHIVGHERWTANSLSIIEITSSFDIPLEHFSDFIETDALMIIHIDELMFGGQRAEFGTEVGVFTSDDLLAGAGLWVEDELMGFAAWSDDPETDEIEGFIDDEEMTLRVWDPDTDREYDTEVTEFIQGENLTWTEGETLVLHLRDENHFELNFNPDIPRQVVAVKDNPVEKLEIRTSPNPFNSATTFSFQIPVSGSYRLNIYNSKGQLVENQQNHFKSPGIHILKWQPDDFPAGLYVVSLSRKDRTTATKVLYLK